VRWAASDIRLLTGVFVHDGVFATETEDEHSKPVLHVSDGRTIRRNPEWPATEGAPKWLVEGPAC
jgi:hypothetical protein